MPNHVDQIHPTSQDQSTRLRASFPKKLGEAKANVSLHTRKLMPWWTNEEPERLNTTLIDKRAPLNSTYAPDPLVSHCLLHDWQVATSSNSISNSKRCSWPLLQRLRRYTSFFKLYRSAPHTYWLIRYVPSNNCTLICELWTHMSVINKKTYEIISVM